MKSIGLKQLKQMKHSFLDLPEEWTPLIGRLPETFNGVLFGKSGQGKSELGMRFDRVAWMGYEQGHDADLQIAINRNNMYEECDGLFIPIDPLQKLPPKKHENETRAELLLRDLDTYMGKRNSPRYLFIDSLDYTGFTFDMYKYLKEKYKKKKGVIYMAHAKGKQPKLQVTKDIIYDGQFGIYVHNLVAEVEKSRIGGRFPYMIWPEEVKRRAENNPKLYSKEIHLMIEKMAS
jgi:hypothetical protein